MVKDVIEKISSAGVTKVKFLEKSISRYFAMSFLAGFYVGIGILLIFTIGGLAVPVAGPFGARVLMGICFGVALSLVIMAGSELFTGNNLIMTISTLNKKTTWKNSFYIWLISYLGNFAGAIVLGLLFYYTKLYVHFIPGAPDVLKFMSNIANIKATTPFIELFFRGLLCNILVCLAVWCCFKMTSESGKLIMIWWCLFSFITIGLEHSIANMTLFSSLMFYDSNFLFGMIQNLIPVTLGNMVGGIILGGFYYFISNKD
ncbi:formate/nitrite transporter family protein [Cetobacterium sp. SF1]|uniref:formate/nitrite transporter family protein n=1 Tax=unclassified Cetobacterium TaxID=2630983 RepID=UPI003CEBC740